MEKKTQPSRPMAVGRCVRVFDHPYFALTDEYGNFEIKNAPAGNYRIVLWHEEANYKGGIKGKFGEPISIKAPTTELKSVEFDVTKRQ